jgi:exo-1,4-beta-D-glucosaminidase
MLENADGTKLSTNFYWISAKPTVYDWDKTTYRYTPAASYEDFGALQSLPSYVPIDASTEIRAGGEGPTVRVKLANRGNQLAFQLHLAIVRKNDESKILPLLWQDNYLELMPGESREITAQFLSPDSLGSGAELRISGWNIKPQTISLSEEIGAKR